MSRLRTLLQGCLQARPYRLDAHVTADFLEVLNLVAAGQTSRALASYSGPLLVESEVARIEELRNELTACLRRAALDGSAADLWRWLETDHGHEDLEALQAYVGRAGAHDARRDLVAARLRSLIRRWELDR